MSTLNESVLCLWFWFVVHDDFNWFHLSLVASIIWAINALKTKKEMEKWNSWKSHASIAHCHYISNGMCSVTCNECAWCMCAVEDIWSGRIKGQRSNWFTKHILCSEWPDVSLSASLFPIPSLSLYLQNISNSVVVVVVVLFTFWLFLHSHLTIIHTHIQFIFYLPFNDFVSTLVNFLVYMCLLLR